MSFRLLKKSKKSRARIGILRTNHGRIRTPFFMPVATQGAVKTLSAVEMKKLGAQIILANTYHLMLRPGAGLIKKLGGLHNFCGWWGPILTDSGGFQVFSLANNKTKTGKSLVEIEEKGVWFQSFWDGSQHFLSPERSLEIQLDLGVDIAVCLDVCPALPTSRKKLSEAVDLTTYWAQLTKKRFKNIFKNKTLSRPLVFAVIQGGLEKDLRLKSLAALKEIGFDGYNIGGLSVGEPTQEMYKVLDYLTPAMPTDKPRYLMGVGYPENIVEAVRRGVDMFDCVIPTREGRHGRLFLFTKQEGKINFNRQFYQTIQITRPQFARDSAPINPFSAREELRFTSRAFLHYLFKIGEPLAARLATLNNLEFYLNLMKHLRQAIREDKF